MKKKSNDIIQMLLPLSISLSNDDTYLNVNYKSKTKQIFIMGGFSSKNITKRSLVMAGRIFIKGKKNYLVAA